jgi:hypothetical protein
VDVNVLMGGVDVADDDDVFAGALNFFEFSCNGVVKAWECENLRLVFNSSLYLTRWSPSVRQTCQQQRTLPPLGK